MVNNSNYFSGTSNKRKQKNVDISYSNNILGGLNTVDMSAVETNPIPPLGYTNSGVIPNEINFGTVGNGTSGSKVLTSSDVSTAVDYTENNGSEQGDGVHPPVDTSGGDPNDGVVPAIDPELKEEKKEEEEEIPTYDAYMQIKEAYEKEKALIEQQKKDALERAEAERKRKVLDAAASYEQNKATYGANAERLASMGLTGSGYSEYINQQAYAAQRGDKQAANALAESTKLEINRQADLDKMDAELSYTQNMANKADEILNTYTNTLDAINKSGGNFDKSILDTMLKNGKLDKDSYDRLVNHYAKSVAEADTSEKLDELREQGNISDATYQDIIKDWNDTLDTSTDTFAGLDYESAKKKYEQLVKDSRTSDETKKKLQSTYTRVYAKDIAKEYVGESVIGGTVDITNKSYNSKQWGAFNDSGKANSEQERLIGQYVNDAKEGKIPVGHVIVTNYGMVQGDYGVYVYVGEGVFVKCSNDARNNYPRYVPEGYKTGANNTIRK